MDTIQTLETPRNQVLGNSTPSLRERAQANIDEAIRLGRENTVRLIQEIMDTRIQDRFVLGRALKFQIEEREDKPSRIVIRLTDADGISTVLDVHRHAMHQLAERVEIPWKFVDTLTGKGKKGIELLRHNFQELYELEEARFLLRSVNGRLMGFLSDKYRRLDTGPLIEAFAGACRDVGALPYQGKSLDTKVVIHAILPKLYEPIPNEIMAYGASFEDSSFGNGPTQVSLFALRAICLNGMIMQRSIRQIHLGRQTGDDFAYQQDTYEADSRALALEIRDVVRNQLSTESLEELQATIQKAHADKLSPETITEILRRSLTKKETDRVIERFNSPDVEMLPPGNTRWRLSNTLSWLAGNEEDPEKSLEFQRLAGQVVYK